MSKKPIIPKLKKNVSSFFKEEKGTISKQSMVSIGGVVGAAAISGVLSSDDVDAAAISLTSSDDGVTASVSASHSHHSSHSSHGSHGSHSSHGSHGSHSSHSSASDIRLKKDVEVLHDALERLGTLHGVSFRWKDSGEKSTGVIAQEVERVFPDLVSEDERGLKRVEYDKLVGPLIEGMKIQQKEILALHKRLARLEAREERLSR